MKKSISFLLVLMMVISLFTACGSQPATSSTETTKASETVAAAESTVQEPVEDLKGKTITVGCWGGSDAEVAAIDKMIADFTSKTGIKVEKKVYTDYNTQIKADLAGGVAPDTFYVDAFIAPYFISEGVLQELDQTVVGADKYYSSLTNPFMNDGKLYALPKDHSSLALYYNKQMLKEADLPKTQEELYSAEYLKKIQDKLSKGKIAMTYNNDLARLMDIMQIGGKDITKDGDKPNLSDPAIIDNLKMVFDAAKAKRILTPADLGKGWNGEAFGNEMTAMMIEGNWVLGFLDTNFPKLDYGVVEVPTYKGNKTSMTFTVGYGINNKAKEAKAATEFIKYACGEEGMNTWCSGAGVLPSRADVAKTMGVDSDIKKAPHVAAAAYATPWQKGITLEVINKSFQNYFASAVKGEITLEDALKKADDEANNQIK